MSIWRLFVRELLYRRWNFVLAVLAVVTATGCLVAQMTLLRLHDGATHTLLQAKEAETAERIEREAEKTALRLVKFEDDTRKRLAAEKAKIAARVKKAEDDYRKITKQLGFNILIVSDRENIPLLEKRQFASEVMPEAYVKKLAESKIITINHLLPMVQEEVNWPGLESKVILNGVRGEVPLMHADEKKPLMDFVPPGAVILGHFVHKLLGVKEKDKVEFKGRTFTVHKLHAYRGRPKDDWSVWMNLAEAQELLGRKGKINAIWALECNCATEDRLAEVRAEVKGILPNTEVLEVYTDALVRAEARERIKKEAADAIADFTAAADTALAQERAAAAATVAQEEARGADELVAVRKGRNEIRGRISAFATVFIPLLLMGSIVWLGLMTLSNVQQRESEIGILRALGLSAGAVYSLFVGRALVVGIVGSLLGCAVGIVLAFGLGESDLALVETSALFSPVLLAAVLLATPLLCALVGWMAAVAAARQDPAVILQHT